MKKLKICLFIFSLILVNSACSSGIFGKKIRTFKGKFKARTDVSVEKKSEAPNEVEIVVNDTKEELVVSVNSNESDITSIFKNCNIKWLDIDSPELKSANVVGWVGYETCKPISNEGEGRVESRIEIFPNGTMEMMITVRNSLDSDPFYGYWTIEGMEQ